MRKEDPCVPKIAIVYFSGYGHTAKQTQAVRAGAESVTNSVVSVADPGIDPLLLLIGDYASFAEAIGFYGHQSG
jgi:hypothetical protein